MAQTGRTGHRQLTGRWSAAWRTSGAAVLGTRLDDARGSVGRGQLRDAAPHLGQDRRHQLCALVGGRVVAPRLLPQRSELQDDGVFVAPCRAPRSLLAAASVDTLTGFPIGRHLVAGGGGGGGGGAVAGDAAARRFRRARTGRAWALAGPGWAWCAWEGAGRPRPPAAGRGVCPCAAWRRAVCTVQRMHAMGDRQTQRGTLSFSDLSYELVVCTVAARSFGRLCNARRDGRPQQVRRAQSGCDGALTLRAPPVRLQQKRFRPPGPRAPPPAPPPLFPPPHTAARPAGRSCPPASRRRSGCRRP